MIKKFLTVLSIMVLFTITLNLFPPAHFHPGGLADFEATFLRKDSESISGVFNIYWGDTRQGEKIARLIYRLYTDRHQSIQLELPEPHPRSLIELAAWRGMTVQAVGDWIVPSSPQNREARFRAREVRLSGGTNAQAPSLSGPQPWITVLCKFNDVPAEPKPVSYFLNMYGSAYPGLDHYWRESSYNTINLFGSDSVNEWYTLPRPRAEYVYDNDNDGQPELDFDRAAQDCAGAAESDKYFPDFVGIQLMFNAELDGYAWGGSHTLTLNGVTQNWSMTWEPPWGYADLTIIEHSMGHGFGLPHSCYDPNAIYDNRWDVMSDSLTDCENSRDPVFGCLGQHTIGYHKEIDGWIPVEKKTIVPPGSQVSITLQQLALPSGADSLLIQIPIGGSSTHFYTVEARRRSGYDIKLPGEGVIIHEVNTTRDIPAWVIDIDGNGNTGDGGAIWTVGETFQDTTNGIWVRVDATSVSGYEVTISNGAGAITRTPTSSSTATGTLTSTITPTPTRTGTGTATRTPTRTGTPTITRTPTRSPTSTQTGTRTPTATATRTPTPSSTMARTPTPTQTLVVSPTPSRTATNQPSGAEVIVQSVWTADASQEARGQFFPGEEILYFGEVYNNNSSRVTADFLWDVWGPCGQIAYYSGPLEVDPGPMTWFLPSSIPVDACGGTYHYQLSVTFNGWSSIQAITFHVVSSITPTPTRTATPSTTIRPAYTPTKTATPVFHPRYWLYLPAIHRW